jgi:signal transduction histidine kinase/CheY-like chemotaxis protein
MYVLYGVEPANFSGDYDAWKQTLHPEDFERASKEVELAIQGDKEFDTTFRVVTGSGDIRTIRARAKVYRNSMNVPVRMSGLNYDITEQIESEKQLKAQQKMNFHQSKLASIGELAAGVGHELNNPLQIMLGYLSTIKHDVDKWDEGKTKDSFLTRIDKISDAITRMTHIVSGLRTFSRDVNSDLENFSPVEIMYSMVDFIRDIYRSYNISVVVDTDIPAGKHFVYGDVSKLQQIFMNLFSNSRDALENVSDAKISVTAKMMGKEVVFEVSDNGSGIPMGIKEKVFDPFFTSKPVGKGTGIGLSITKNFAEDLNGSIKIKSTSKKGTCFEIRIPAEESRRVENSIVDNDTKVNTRMTTPGGKAKPRVLVVEDEEGLREVFSKAMSRDGFYIETAADGLEAFELCSKNTYDFLITDIQMPKMSGIELLQKLKEEGMLPPETRVLILTGGVAQEMEENIQATGVAIEKVFYKPIRVKHLLAYLNDSEDVQEKVSFQ